MIKFGMIWGGLDDTITFEWIASLQMYTTFMHGLQFFNSFKSTFKFIELTNQSLGEVLGLAVVASMAMGGIILSFYQTFILRNPGYTFREAYNFGILHFLGNYEVEDYAFDSAAYLWSLVGVVVINIFYLNMIIAVLSDAYAYVMQYPRGIDNRVMLTLLKGDFVDNPMVKLRDSSDMGYIYWYAGKGAEEENQSEKLFNLLRKIEYKLEQMSE